MNNIIETFERPAWKCATFRVLTPEEKGDKHHVFVDVIGLGGEDARGTVKIRFGWDGMTSEEMSYLSDVPTDKQIGEPAANVPIMPGQLLWVEVSDGDVGSDRICGMDAYNAYSAIFRYAERETK